MGNATSANVGDESPGVSPEDASSQRLHSAKGPDVTHEAANGSHANAESEPEKLIRAMEAGESSLGERDEGGADANLTATSETGDLEGSEVHPEAVDEATTQLILKLQLKDLKNFERRSMGQEPDDQISDLNLARRVYQEELRAAGQVLYDRRMTNSMGMAVRYDGEVLGTYSTLERHENQDRLVACRLAGQEGSPVTVPQINEYDDDFIARLDALYVGGDSGSLGEGTYSEEPKIDCEICRDTVPQTAVANLPCGHPYCSNCLRRLFQASFTDESLFPPRCCRQEITVEVVQPFLEPGDLETFRQKFVEFETPDKTYCCLPTCSTFIPPNEINDDRAVCGICGTITCSICKSEAHDGDCPEDTETQQLLEVASEQGWKRCFNCSRMIELGVGCYHMTCHCGSEFCYLCGEEWKTCSCRLWDEGRLVHRALQLADREDDVQLPRRARVERAMRNLRDECRHANWRVIREAHQCEVCMKNLPTYILRCRRCQLHACVRCRRNRL